MKIGKSWDHIGMRPTGNHIVIFEDVVAPEDYVAGLVDLSYVPDYTTRLGICHAVGALHNGIAKALRA
ncbi:hypothetical protein [Komagataeibacter sp. FXV3]|uniref:hypothetical protein n=1 Tax=Komagataeibacter sp. FXV3 TaxID=2608998 RepID=UPI00187B9EFD|nr:hypothetical protein [Komagataeibacter sp. FXV3]MBE7728596.1 hypothetical protein [Komagataeibacter sp. FXV3]